MEFGRRNACDRRHCQRSDPTKPCVHVALLQIEMGFDTVVDARPALVRVNKAAAAGIPRSGLGIDMCGPCWPAFADLQSSHAISNVLRLLSSADDRARRDDH